MAMMEEVGEKAKAPQMWDYVYCVAQSRGQQGEGFPITAPVILTKVVLATETNSNMPTVTAPTPITETCQTTTMKTKQQHKEEKKPSQLYLHLQQCTNKQADTDILVTAS